MGQYGFGQGTGQQAIVRMGVYCVSLFRSKIPRGIVRLRSKDLFVGEVGSRRPPLGKNPLHPKITARIRSSTRGKQPQGKVRNHFGSSPNLWPQMLIENVLVGPDMPRQLWLPLVGEAQQYDG